MPFAGASTVRWVVLCCVLFVAGCAFDVISIKQVPTEFVAAPAAERWVMAEDTRVELVQGRASLLRKGTIWQRTGHIGQGDVLRTRDQVVTVVASNEYEAQLVINADMIVGFYLPVERTFTPALSPMAFKAAHP